MPSACAWRAASATRCIISTRPTIPTAPWRPPPCPGCWSVTTSSCWRMWCPRRATTQHPNANGWWPTAARTPPCWHATGASSSTTPRHNHRPRQSRWASACWWRPSVPAASPRSRGRCRSAFGATRPGWPRWPCRADPWLLQKQRPAPRTWRAPTRRASAWATTWAPCSSTAASGTGAWTACTTWSSACSSSARSAVARPT